MLKELLDKLSDATAAMNAAMAPHSVIVAGLRAQAETLAKEIIGPISEGEKSINVADVYTVRVAKPATRDADSEAIKQAWERLPAAVQECFRFEAAIDLRRLRKLSDADATTAAALYTTRVGEAKVKIEVRKP
jgi:hypothetical protein